MDQVDIVADIRAAMDQDYKPTQKMVRVLLKEYDRLTALCDGYRGEVASLKAELADAKNISAATIGHQGSLLESATGRAEQAESALTRARADAVAETLDEAAELGSEWAMSYVEVDTAALRCGEYIKKYFKGDSK